MRRRKSLCSSPITVLLVSSVLGSNCIICQQKQTIISSINVFYSFTVWYVLGKNCKNLSDTEASEGWEGKTRERLVSDIFQVSISAISKMAPLSLSLNC